jgi:hypothetical protein
VIARCCDRQRTKPRETQHEVAIVPRTPQRRARIAGNTVIAPRHSLMPRGDALSAISHITFAA